ncbi:DUF3108 domain-containing protein [Ideonella margarita]|uniref:DUF3108 domain-containing protein n=1 Tax=Ideonella margarita TaxID=2984191 RepID=A0ABU9C5P5_9BURK
MSAVARALAHAPARRWAQLGLLVAVLVVHWQLLAPGMARWAANLPATPTDAEAPVAMLVVAVAEQPPALAPAAPPTPTRHPTHRASAAEPIPAPPPATEVLEPEAAPANPAQATAAAREPARPPPAERNQPAPQLPAAGHWAYTAQRGERVGQAQLDWEPQPDGSYRLAWRLTLAGRPATGWSSQGQLSAEDGLLPQRMVEHRGERATRAVNFQRDKQVVSFSGSTAAHPLETGTQDRASWLVQLAGLAQAMGQRLQAGHSLVVPVALPGGQLDAWQFEVVGPVLLTLPGHTALPCVHLLREPARPWDQRVEVWLAPSMGHWPVQLRHTPVPSGEPLLLQWAGDRATEIPGAPTSTAFTTPAHP